MKRIKVITKANQSLHNKVNVESGYWIDSKLSKEFIESVNGINNPFGNEYAETIRQEHLSLIDRNFTRFPDKSVSNSQKIITTYKKGYTNVKFNTNSQLYRFGRIFEQQRIVQKRKREFYLSLFL